MKVKHSFTSAKGEGTDASKVRTSAWNADHLVGVKAFGAKGDDGTDDTTALQRAISEADGPVTIPPGVYRISEPLVPAHNRGFIGLGYSSAIGGGVAPPARIVGSGGFAIFDAGAVAVNDFILDGLGLIGTQGEAGSRGIYAEAANNWTLRNLFGDGFADQGIFIRGGVAGVYENIWVQNACVDRESHSTWIGAVQFGDTSHWVSDIHARLVGGYCGGWNGTLGEYESGYHCGLIAGASTSVFEFCYGSWSETGIKTFAAVSDFTQFTNCRADHNQGDGFDVAGGSQTYLGNLALNNGRAADATYSGFRVRNGNNLFDANTINSSSVTGPHQLYGFNDDSDAGSAGNRYGALNRAGGVISGGLYHVTSWGEQPGILDWVGRRLNVKTAPVISGGDANAAGYLINGAAGLLSGAGSPEGVVTAPVGTLWMRTDGGANTSLYVKESGSGNTGWVAK